MTTSHLGLGNLAEEKSSSAIKAGLIGFSDKDTRVFTSLLSLSEKWRQRDWEIVSPESADICFTFLPDDSSVRLQCVNAMKNLRVNDVIDYPIRARVLLDAVFKIEDLIGLDQNSTSQFRSPPARTGGHHDLATLLSEKMQQADSESSWYFTLDDEPMFKVDLGQALVYQLCDRDTPQLPQRGSYEIVHDCDDLVVSPHVPKIALERWLWQLGISLSKYGLFSWLNWHSTYARLKWWPDFGLLQHHKEHLRLAAYLHYKALTPQQLRDASGANNQYVISVLNACALLGCLDHEDRRENNSRAPSVNILPRFVGLIRERLNL